MGIGDAGNKSDLWPRQTGQAGNLASRIHAHLLNGKISMFGQAGKGNRHANVIVKAALAGVATAQLCQRMPQHVLASGFANRPGNAKFYALKALPTGYRQLA